jgi:uncharacterized RDD family membrane protein YckC
MSRPWPPAPAWTPPTETAGPAPGVRFAPHGERLLAYVVDSLLLSVLAIAGMMVLPNLIGYDGTRSSRTLLGFVALIGIIAVNAYYPVLWSIGGQTIGMKLFGLRVVRDRDGGPVGIGRALLRTLGFVLNGLVLYLGFVWIFIDSRRRDGTTCSPARW